MSADLWLLNTPIDAVLFDCDGTLASIEGIDELATMYHVGDIVHRLTQEAMGKHGMSTKLFAERLALVKPTAHSVDAIGTAYITHRIPDIEAVIQLFKRINKTIYIISAGLLPAVRRFGAFLQIPEENIFAVPIQFTATGEYLDFDHTSPLTKKHGKREIVAQIKSQHKNLAYIGDGLSDYEVYDLVTRFIGFGGAYYRESIEKHCQFYIKTQQMAPLVPLLLTQTEKALLLPEELALYNQGMAAIAEHHVHLKY